MKIDISSDLVLLLRVNSLILGKLKDGFHIVMSLEVRLVLLVDSNGDSLMVILCFSNLLLVDLKWT